MIEVHNPKTGASKRCEIEHCRKNDVIISIGFNKYKKVPYDNIKWVSSDWHFKSKKRKIL